MKLISFTLILFYLAVCEAGILTWRNGRKVYKSVNRRRLRRVNNLREYSRRRRHFNPNFVRRRRNYEQYRSDADAGNFRIGPVKAALGYPELNKPLDEYKGPLDRFSRKIVEPRKNNNKIPPPPTTTTTQKLNTPTTIFEVNTEQKIAPQKVVVYNDEECEEITTTDKVLTSEELPNIEATSVPAQHGGNDDFATEECEEPDQTTEIPDIQTTESLNSGNDVTVSECYDDE